MNDIKDGGPAFPTAEIFHDEVVYTGGMTLRDYFAAKAMQGFISCCDPCNIELDVKAAYIWADYMLEARKQNE